VGVASTVTSSQLTWAWLVGVPRQILTGVPTIGGTAAATLAAVSWTLAFSQAFAAPFVARVIAPNVFTPPSLMKLPSARRNETKPCVGPLHRRSRQKRPTTYSRCPRHGGIPSRRPGPPRGLCLRLGGEAAFALVGVDLDVGIVAMVRSEIEQPAGARKVPFHRAAA